MKSKFIEAFRKACLDHTHNCSTWDSKLDHSVETPFPYPITGGKYTIDENYGKKQICIRCKKCWTDDLLIVAKKVAGRFNATVSSSLSVGGFGIAYNFFTVHFK